MNQSVIPSEDFGYSHVSTCQKPEQESIRQSAESLKCRRPNTLEFSPSVFGNRDINQKSYVEQPNVLSVCDLFQKSVNKTSTSRSTTSTTLSICAIKRPSFLPIPSQGSSSSGFQKLNDGCISGNSKIIIPAIKTSSLDARSVHFIHTDSGGLLVKNTQLSNYGTCLSFLKRRVGKRSHIFTGKFETMLRSNTRLNSVLCFDKFPTSHKRLFHFTLSRRKGRAFNYPSPNLGDSKCSLHSHTFSSLSSIHRCHSGTLIKNIKLTSFSGQTSSARLRDNYHEQISNSVGTISFEKFDKAVESPVVSSNNLSNVYDVLMESSKKLSQFTNKRYNEQIISPTTIPSEKNGHTINVNIDEANRVFQQRVDPLLRNTSLDVNRLTNRQLHTSTKLPQIHSNESIWPPLIISFHPELVLQFNPSTGLLASLLENKTVLSDSIHNKNVFKSSINSSKDSLHSMTITPITKSEYVSKSEHVPPGITIALTRNLHIHVHPTELSCCLKQPAWCFASSGFYQFGQEEIVILLRRRPNEKLPPLDIFYQYWLIYQALVNYTEKQMKSDINFESFNSQTYNKPFGSAPFRSHDCFFEKLYFANNRFSSSPNANSDMANGYSWLDFKSLASSYCQSINPYGFIFFHPTHQCLLSLHVPNPPFLVALLVHIQEAPWAYRLPSRILLNLGKMSHYYPTTLLSDRDRRALFNCKLGGESFLQLFTNITPFIYPDFMTYMHTEKCTPLPELLFHINGFYAHLKVVKDELDDNITTNNHNNNDESVIVELLITGLSFVAFSGHASHCSALIIEDGVYISLTNSKFYQLVNGLRSGSDLSILIRSSCNNQPTTVINQVNNDFGNDIANPATINRNVASSVHVKWFKVFDSFLSSASFSSTVTSSCCASSVGVLDIEPFTTFLVPVHYQLWHWAHLNETIISSSENQVCFLSTKPINPPLLRLAWIRFHILNVDQLEIVNTPPCKSITFEHLSNEVAECVVKALQPYLRHLQNCNRTQITLRILLQPPDLVGYQMGASSQEVYTFYNQLHPSNGLRDVDCENGDEIYADALDDILLPVLSTWSNCLRFVNRNSKGNEPLSSVTSDSRYHLDETIQMEFDFCILN
ncbi:mothers against decapentaplegic interacting protein [Schistosoma japonicum]|nr:mothers against decapentaplegic interacting protein [Schistosoma japonicum]KAH8865324.1 mothers against decapentaplegic interacting protein [Schistosoma japonicum]